VNTDDSGGLQRRNERSWLSGIFLPALFFLLSLYLLYGVFRPFLEPLFWAAILAVIFHPAYRRLRALTSRDSSAAAIILLLVLMLLVIPVTCLVNSLVDELSGAVRLADRAMIGLKEIDLTTVPVVSSIWDRIEPHVGLDAEAFRTAVMARIRTWSAEGVRHFSSLFLDLVSFAFQSAIMLVSLYFFLKDGHIIVKGLSSFVPLLPEDRRRLVDTLDGTVTATLHGGLSVAVVQGLVGGLAFWLLGLRAPVLWGTAMGFLAFVPVVGASLVWIPAAIYLFATGRLAEGITLVVVGALVISMIDYVLRPIIIGNRTRQHTLLILLSVLGGIQSFGFIGIVAGPMVVAFFAAMIEFFQTGASQPPPPGPAGPSTDTADAPP